MAVRKGDAQHSILALWKGLLGFGYHKSQAIVGPNVVTAPYLIYSQPLSAHWI